MPSGAVLAEALRPLPAGYHRLAARVVAAAEGDARIRALWLSGSLGRGVADAGSDLDVVVALEPAAFDDFAATWRDWLAGITPTLLARDLPRLPGSFYSVTAECLRLDVVAERAGTASAGALALRLLILDKDGRAGLTAAATAAATAQAAPAARAATPVPDPAKLAELTEEFLRQLTIFPAAVVAREDWLLGVVGVQHIQMLLYQLFVESNQPLPPMGVKQWSAKLTTGQRAVCAGLPSPAASREAVLTAMRAAAAAFRQAARDILAARQIPWPAGFDQAVRRYWLAELGWTE